MKTKNTKKSAGIKYNAPAREPLALKEAAVAYEVEEQAMVRTQIYLSKQEHDFVQQEANRKGQPMAAVIRAFIDEKMEVPEDVWMDNPLLAPPVPDRSWDGREDGAINHDHYIYGSPKKWVQRKGKWVEAPPLPDDYHTNPKSRKAYDDEVKG